MGDTHRTDLNDLRRMARSRSVVNRTRLAEIIADLFSGGGEFLNEREHALMSDILRRLIHDVEMAVRKRLAERLAESTQVPHELLFVLANDDIEVAYPVLVNSPVLRDAELIEIIHHRTLEHQLAIATRRSVSQTVSDALIGTGHAEVIRTLLENTNARISHSTLAYLVEQSKRVDSFQGPLVRRQDLPRALALRMTQWVSAALRQFVLKNFEITPTDLDPALSDAVTMVAEEEPPCEGKGATSRLADALIVESKADPRVLVDCLRQGEIALFEALLGKITGLRSHLVKRLVYEPGGEGLAVACRACGIQKPAFVWIFKLSRTAGRGQDGFDLDDQLAGACAIFDRVDVAAAQSLLRYWRRNPDYLRFLRSLEERLGSPGDPSAAGVSAQT